jgi:hypothetical protein
MAFHSLTKPIKRSLRTGRLRCSDQERVLGDRAGPAFLRKLVGPKWCGLFVLEQPLCRFPFMSTRLTEKIKV